MKMVKDQKERETEEQEDFHDKIFEAMREQRRVHGEGASILNPLGLQEFYHDFQAARHREKTLPFLDEWKHSFAAALPGPDDTDDLVALQEALEEEDVGRSEGSDNGQEEEEGVFRGATEEEDGSGAHVDP